MVSDESILNQDQCLKRILYDINKVEPGSYIRKGDGENIFLGYRKLNQISFFKYRKKLIHFNIRIWDKQFQTFLKEELAQACSIATILGISLPEHRHGFWSIEEKIIHLLSLENMQYEITTMYLTGDIGVCPKAARACPDLLKANFMQKIREI